MSWQTIQGTWILKWISGGSCANELFPKARQAIIDAGGLIPFTRQLLIEGVMKT